MSVRGWATGCKLVNQGSELVAAASVGATALEVDWVGDFADTGGTLRLNGVDLEYSGVDRVAETVTLSVPLAVAATDGDSVDVVTSGQVLKDYTLFVTLGLGDDAQVDIPFGDRDAWPEGGYDEPVEVLLSDDLERIESVPGVLPVRRIIGGYIATADDDEGERLVLRNDGSGGILEAYSGIDGEAPGGVNPFALFGMPGITLASGTLPTATESSVLSMAGGATGASATSLRSATIDLVGDVYVDGVAKTTGAFFSTTLPTGSGSPVVMRGADGRIHIDSSSRRFKENIEPADEAGIVAALLQIVTKTYTRNDGDPTVEGDMDRRFLGTIAEEVADTGLEYLVNRDVEGLPFSINQGAMVTALLAGFRVLSARVDALEAQEGTNV
jgi:hypothetical protein